MRKNQRRAGSEKIGTGRRPFTSKPYQHGSLNFLTEHDCNMLILITEWIVIPPLKDVYFRSKRCHIKNESVKKYHDTKSLLYLLGDVLT